MENLVAATVETPAVEKVAKITLPEIKVEDYKALEFKSSNTPGAEVAIITTGDITEYAQIAAVVKTCEKVLYSSGTRTCTIIVDGSLERNVNQVALLNPELKGKVVAIHITYNGAEKLRLSAKTTGTAKAKKTLKGSFFDLDLANVIDLDGANYIYGKEGSEFSKETNTKIARVVKAMLPYGILYSDEDKSGFHKSLSKIPTDVRVDAENYVFFFKWNEIAEKLSLEKVTERIAENLIAKATPKGGTISEDKVAEIKVEASNIAKELNVDANEVIADIIDVITFFYPSLVVDTTKDLIIECSKSTFASLKSEKLAFDKATKTVVSKKAEEDAAKAAKKAEKAAAAEKAKVEAAAKKAEKAKAEVAEEKVEIDLGVDASGLGMIDPTLDPIQSPAELLTVPGTQVDASGLGMIDPTALLNNLTPAN